LAHHGRIDLPCAEEAWFEKALDGSGITLLPTTARNARIAVQLPEYHRAPRPTDYRHGTDARRHTHFQG
jgi:PIN domain nuclease of toxin-antitoxin system